jgi:hypothetical protein
VIVKMETGGSGLSSSEVEVLVGKNPNFVDPASTHWTCTDGLAAGDALSTPGTRVSPPRRSLALALSPLFLRVMRAERERESWPVVCCGVLVCALSLFLSLSVQSRR